MLLVQTLHSKIDISNQRMDQLVGFLLYPHFLKLPKNVEIHPHFQGLFGTAGLGCGLGHGIGYRLGHGIGYGIGHGLECGLGNELGYGLGYELGYGLGYRLQCGLGHGIGSGPHPNP